MKRLTREEALGIEQEASGRGSFAYRALMNMGVGDIILLEKGDWTWRTMIPSTYCLRLGRKKNRKWRCNRVRDGSGWVIERVK